MVTVGLGNALVDVLSVLKSDELLEQLSLPRGSMQLVDNDLSLKIQAGIKDGEKHLVTGGSASNTISGLAAMGVPCHFIGKTGKDETGDFFQSDMEKHGVITHLVKSELPTGVCVSLVSPDSERTMATCLGAASTLTESDFDPSWFKGVDLCHIEGYLVQNTTMIETAMKMAKAAGAKISLDLASYNVVEENLEFLRRIVKEYVDIVFANEEEAKAFAQTDPESALDYIAEMCEIAVVKLGKKGSLVKKGGKSVRIEPLANVKAIDTTAAGDLFAAGFLYGLHKGYGMKRCGNIGSLVSGHIVQVIGSKMSEETWTEILSKA